MSVVECCRELKKTSSTHEEQNEVQEYKEMKRLTRTNVNFFFY